MRMGRFGVPLAVLFLSACIQTLPTAVDCNKITDNNAANECLLNQSIAKMDINGCTNIIDEKMKEGCINRIAVTLADYYPCTNHDKLSKRDKCEALVSEVRRKMRDMAKATTTTNP